LIFFLILYEDKQTLFTELSIDSEQCGLPQWLSSKEPTCSAGAAGDIGLIPGWGRSLEEGMATHFSILGESP